jgi:diguanylate cyclase (GGDEF)-like protein
MGWQAAYMGDYTAAIATLSGLLEQTDDITLKFRAGASVANVFALASRYEEAFQQLSQTLELLPQIDDFDARRQGLAVAAFLYNQVGEYSLGLRYAEQLETEDTSVDRGLCRGGQLRLEALHKGTRLGAVGPEFQRTIDACTRMGEPLVANLVRIYVARIHLDQKLADAAITLLNDHYEEVQNTRYPRVIAEFDALLAQAYREKGETTLARQYALRSIERGVKNQITEPLVAAYRLLYLLAKESGDTRDALAYHERYAAADKGYLDDVTARQLAFQRVNHDTVATKLQIESLNKENQVLQLQQQLNSKAAETSRLYIALLLMLVAFIALWAYRTKRSQLHFKRLSEVDGLTGIANRPRFIELAESALDNAQRGHQEVCVMLCDLDHFKSINDRFGHAAGDHVLKQAVVACQVHLRTSDVFGRFGGEEFGIVLPGCSLEDARLRAEQLRLAINGITAGYAGVEATVSGSFGIATSRVSGYELRQLLAHADAALYQAKDAGRNRVVVYDVKVAIDTATRLMSRDATTSAIRA